MSTEALSREEILDYIESMLLTRVNEEVIEIDEFAGMRVKAAPGQLWDSVLEDYYLARRAVDVWKEMRQRCA